MGFYGKNQYINLINEEWRVEKSKISINVEGGFLFCGGWNFSKSVSVGPSFIREMRVDKIDLLAEQKSCFETPKFLNCYL